MCSTFDAQSQDISARFEPRPEVAIDESKLAALREQVNEGTDFLDLLFNALEFHFPSSPYGNGVGFSLTDGNTLYPAAPGQNGTDSDWIAQTPPIEYWGVRASQVTPDAGKPVADDVQTMISNAQHAVDIVSLAPFPNGRFQQAITNGLANLIKANKNVTVRILVGWYPAGLFLGEGPYQGSYIQQLVAPLKELPQNTNIVKVIVGAQRTTSWSWNHSKIVAVDGAHLIVGGENLWGTAYLQSEPVHDLNVKIVGPTAYYAHRFADSIWETVCGYGAHSGWQPQYWQNGSGKGRCVAKIDVPAPSPPGSNPGVKILGAGRYGPLSGLLNPVNPGDVAIAYAMKSAQSTLRMSQQSLMLGPMAWEPAMTAIANLIRTKKDVYIVLSNDIGKAGDGNKYKGYVELTANRIWWTIFRAISLGYRGVGETPPVQKIRKETNDLLCAHLNLARLRFGPKDDHWPNGYEFANHAKFFMVDDKVFYVGSENLYPSNLIEYGVFVSDPTAVAQMQERYWDNLWKYSKRAAISGPEAKTCYFDGSVQVSPPSAAGEWHRMPGGATDIGVGPDDNAWVVGGGGEAFYWDPNNQIWEPTADNSASLSRIAVGPGGMPWGILSDKKTIVRRAGDTFPGTGWKRMPGGAIDIGVGPEGNVWVVDTIGRPWYWDPDIQNWKRIVDEAVTLSRIAVGPNGMPWGIASHGAIVFRRAGDTFPGTHWEDMTPGLGSDIGVGPDGTAWVVGSGGEAYSWFNGLWESHKGVSLTSIAVGPDNEVRGVNASTMAIYRRSP